MKLTENRSIGISHTNLNSVALTLRNVTSSDSGNHMCIATTASGIAINASVFVNVLSES